MSARTAWAHCRRLRSTVGTLRCGSRDDPACRPGAASGTQARSGPVSGRPGITEERPAPCSGQEGQRTGACLRGDCRARGRRRRTRARAQATHAEGPMGRHPRIQILLDTANVVVRARGASRAPNRTGRDPAARRLTAPRRRAEAAVAASDGDKGQSQDDSTGSADTALDVQGSGAGSGKDGGSDGGASGSGSSGGGRGDSSSSGGSPDTETTPAG
jgi:hypothetical protein